MADNPKVTHLNAKKQKGVCKKRTQKMAPLHEKTPLIESAKLSKLAGRKVLLKLG